LAKLKAEESSGKDIGTDILSKRMYERPIH